MKLVARLCVLTLSLGLNDALAAPLTIADLDQRENVGDAQISPDGSSVLYTVTRNDMARDTKVTSVWQVDWDGSTPRRLSESATAPRWSPDGRWVSYLKDAPDVEGAQVWLVDRHSGATKSVTHAHGGVISYSWSPDGNRLALVLQPPAPNVGPRPWVIDRYRFKTDGGTGYWDAGWTPPRIYVQDLGTGTLQELTRGDGFEESDPAWSPDGTRIALVTNREAERDRTSRTDVYVVDSRPGSEPRRLSSVNRTNSGPLSWNRKGTDISFLQSGELSYGPFEQLEVATVRSSGVGSPEALVGGLDRDTADPAFSAKDGSIRFLVYENRKRYLARVPRAGGRMERLADIPGKILSFTESNSRTVVVATFDAKPPEVYAVEKRSLRQLTHHNESWQSRVEWAPVEDVEFVAADGERIYGLLTLPLGYRAGQRYPTILWIHGGPHLQDEHGLTDHNAYDPRQLFAANGYAVLQVNYRGSHGRGVQFGRGAFADWGNKDVSDLLAGIDSVIHRGVADPERLGVGGWSFGGFLTDYLIVSTPRFAAAVSGAGAGSKLSLYGSDTHSSGNELEFGTPWEHPDLWLRISRPLFEVKNVRTPTLFVGGQLDANVPIAGGEQMYQALKSLRIPTQLVIYPGEHHMIERPSFERDLLQRYLDWYGKYLHANN